MKIHTQIEIQIMKKKVLLNILLLTSAIGYSQVGINNSDPKTSLDVSAKRDALGAVSDNAQHYGLQAPRLTRAEMTALTASYGADQKGAMIYITDVSGGDNSGTRINMDAVGYYYFDGSVWQKLSGGGSSGDATNDAWVNDTTNTMVKLGTKSDGSSRDAGTYFVAKDNGSVGIGTASPDLSALLDITATNKGLLLPRVALNSVSDQTTVSSPATGLIVYNTGTGGLTGKGFVYWNGTEWRYLNNTPAINPSISTLTCSSASVSPSVFVSGTSYNGSLTIPYTGGNGGAYDVGTSFTQNGLTFTQQAGNLNIGNGNVTYSITGTPNFSSPSTINVPITFLGKSCTATVGALDNYRIGETRGFTVSVPASTFLTNSYTSNWMTGKGNAAGTANLGTTTGRSMIEAAGLTSSSSGVLIVKGLRLDFLNEGTGTSVRPVLYNTTSSVVRYHSSALSTNDKVDGGVSAYVNPGYYGIYMDGDSNFLCSNNSNSEYTNVQLTFDDGSWYVLNFHATQVDNVYRGYWVVTRIQ